MCDWANSDPAVVASNTNAPSWLTQFYKDNANELSSQYKTAKNIYNANANYSPYPGQRQQGFTTDQSKGMQMTRDNIGLGQDALAGAAARAGNAAESYSDNVPMNASTVNSYYQGHLGRNASAEESAFWLKNAKTAGDLSSGIGNSLEARNRVAAGVGPDMSKIQDGTFKPNSVQTENYNQSYQAGGVTPQYGTAATTTGLAPLIGTDQSAQQGNFNTSAAQQYMNPYTDTVMRNTLSEMDRQNAKGVAADGARAATSKAFGGSRHGIVDAERARNYSTEQNNVIANLNNQNFAQAQGQFNTDTGRNQQNSQFNAGMAQGAQQSNQNAIMSTVMADQAAKNNMTQFNGQMGVNAQLANEQMRQSAFGINRDTFNQNQDRSFQTQVQNQNMQLQGFNANRDQYNTDSSRQLQSGALALQMAPQIQQMGMQDANNLMSIGGLQQQFGQGGLDIAYQNYLEQKRQPYENFAFLQSALKGANYNPVAGTTTNSTTTGGGPSALQQVTGLAATGLGAYGAIAGW